MSKAVEARLSKMDDEMLSALDARSKARTHVAFEVSQFEPQEGPEFLTRLSTFRTRLNVRSQISQEIIRRRIAAKTGKENNSDQT